MMLIELFAPQGALDGQGRSHLAERLLHELVSHEGTPQEIIEAARRLWHVVVHEPGVWVTGGGAVEPQDPRYFVRVSLPADSHMLSAEMRSHFVSTITRVLADTHGDADRFAREPLVSVHLVDVPSYGTLGRTMRDADVVRLVMGAVDAPAGASTPVAPGADTAIDPICGMTVALTDTAITLEHDGATYAFCAAGCRDVFAERMAAAAH
jgi:YHS domain-containing protein